uniref:Uncharacterized protein n=1 Tax=Andraca bipunctata granulovirus TaxID=270494 RepID=C6F3D0_9BBAC|nr:hypothetical protein [Andraca bipunctata granulovirus]
MTTYIENLKELSSLILKSDYDCPPSEVGTPLHFLCKWPTLTKLLLTAIMGRLPEEFETCYTVLKEKC